MKKLLLSLILMNLGIAFAHEHESHQKEKRSADVHSHGIIYIDMVVENNELDVELDSPAYNFLGFEHKVRTTEEKQALKKVKAHLKEGGFIHLPSKAECRLNSKEFEWDKEGAHADIELSLEYKCKNIKALKEVKFDFSSFDNVEFIEVHYINEKGGALAQKLKRQDKPLQLP